MDSDRQVLGDIIAEFKARPCLHHTRLTVIVRDGEVTISGRVNTFGERTALERAAKSVPGIRTLVLEVRAAAIPDIVVNATSRLDPRLAYG